MDKIHLIVPSLNRAAQLNLLLQSIARNAADFFDVTILYKATTPEFRAGYDLLFERSADYWESGWMAIPESSFKEDVVSLVDPETSLTCFATDDIIVYNNLHDLTSLHNIHYLLDGGPEIACLSLRLGFNTRRQSYDKNDYLRFPEHGSYDNFLVWNASGWGASVYGYKHSVDGHIFRTNYIRDRIAAIDFDNPNSLEANLSGFDHAPDTPRLMACLPQQSIVSNCVNSVSTWANRAGNQHGISAEATNSRYLAGEVIDLDAAVAACKGADSTHIEIPFGWRRY
jgi:hypothetical protein